MMTSEPSELMLIYNSDKVDDQRARGYVESLRGYAIKTLDLAHESLTETQITQLAEKMDADIEDLIDPVYDDHISVHKEGLMLIDRQEMLTLMRNDPKLIDTPILVVGSKAYKCGSGNPFLKEGMAESIRIKNTKPGKTAD